MIFRRRNEDFSGDDFSVIYRHSDGRELHVGRIFRTNTSRADNREVWLWTVEFHQRRERTPPHDGQEPTVERAEIRVAPVLGFRRHDPLAAGTRGSNANVS